MTATPSAPSAGHGKRPRKTLVQRGLALALGLSALACGEGFDPASQIRALRVLGVHKDRPYAAPGESVTMRLVYHDGSPEAPRDLSLLWLTCVNPPGDLYWGCFEQFAALAEAGEAPTIAVGDTLTFDVPEDIVTSRPPPAPGNPQYGVGVAFFAICAGELGFEVLDERSLPLVCRGPTGEPRGPDDFVAGYTMLYSFAGGFENENPIVTGFRIGGVDVEPDCIDAECVEAESVPPDCDADSTDARCLPVCAGDCPELEVRPIVDPASAERDEVSAHYFGRDVWEQMWINYYVDGGKLVSSERLLSDAQTGWYENHGAKFTPPAEAGPVRLWAVVHDNRGGASFVRVTVQAQ